MSARVKEGGKVFQSYKNMLKKIHHQMTNGLSGILGSNPDAVFSASGSWTGTRHTVPLSYLFNGE